MHLSPGVLEDFKNQIGARSVIGAPPADRREQRAGRSRAHQRVAALAEEKASAFLRLCSSCTRLSADGTGNVLVERKDLLGSVQGARCVRGMTLG